jgi:hypothetical protein
MKRAARIWKRTYLRGDRLLSHIPKSDRLRIRYEDLCKCPKVQTCTITNLLSINYEDTMLNLSTGIGHSIAGNNMKWILGNKIKLNEKWKRELSEEELNIFQTIAGKINFKYGYDKN